MLAASGGMSTVSWSSSPTATSITSATMLVTVATAIARGDNRAGALDRYQGPEALAGLGVPDEEPVAVTPVGDGESVCGCFSRSGPTMVVRTYLFTNGEPHSAYGRCEWAQQDCQRQ